MNTTQNLCFLCQILSNDIKFNPGPAYARSTLTRQNSMEMIKAFSELQHKQNKSAIHVWSKSLTITTSQGLPKGVNFGHLNIIKDW